MTRPDPKGNPMTDPTPTPAESLPRFTEPPPRPTDSNLAQHAWDELNRAGLFTTDGDFDGGMTGRALLELVETFAAQDYSESQFVETFAAQGHSGISALRVALIFERLCRFEVLSPLTDNPDEWSDVGGGLWQSRRNSKAFSNDGGRTYRLNSSRDVLHQSEPAVTS